MSGASFSPKTRFLYVMYIILEEEEEEEEEEEAEEEEELIGAGGGGGMSRGCWLRLWVWWDNYFSWSIHLQSIALFLH